MRIAQVNTSDQGGGAERIARSLHHAYRGRGHEATFYVGRRRTADDGIVELRNGGRVWGAHDSLRDAGHARLARVVGALVAPQTVIDTVRGREDFVFPGTRALVGAAASLDVLQLHNLHGSYFDLRLLPELSARVPVFLCPQDQWPTTGHVAYSFECERWRTGCGSCPHPRTYPALIADGTATNWRRKADIYRRSSLRVSVPSRWLADIVADSMLAPAVRELRVIPNGVDLDLFHPGDRAAARSVLGIGDDASVVVFTAQSGRAPGFKDPATLLAALARLGATSGGEVVAAILGGDAVPDGALGRVRVRSVGYVANDEVSRWLTAADLYLHAARADTFPVAVLEALACGVPVVATAVGGVPEQLTSRTGILVPPGDPEAMAEAAARVLAEPGLRRAMGDAAAVDAVARFGLTRQVDAYLDWFAEVVC
jgi:glycosyltransferase involved in cell wall biosynthesis